MRGRREREKSVDGIRVTARAKKIKDGTGKGKADNGLDGRA